MALDSVEAAENALMADIGNEQAEAQPTPEVSQQGQGPTTEEVESFTNIDPTTLPPELQPLYKSMQADYTRKTQGVAQLRALGDPEQVAAAVEFVQRLTYDPSLQQELYQNLSQHLQSMGMTPQQANAAAAQQVQQTMQGGQEDYDEDSWDDEDDYDPRVDELNERLARIEGFQQQELLARQMANLENVLTQQETYIRQNNPSYKDEDINDIYAIAHSTNGNLIKAQEAYEAAKQRWAAAYMEQKQTASPPPVMPTGNYGQQPKEFKDVYDPELEKAALAMLAADMAN